MGSWEKEVLESVEIYKNEYLRNMQIDQIRFILINPSVFVALLDSGSCANNMINVWSYVINPKYLASFVDFQ